MMISRLVGATVPPPAPAPPLTPEGQPWHTAIPVMAFLMAGAGIVGLAMAVKEGARHSRVGRRMGLRGVSG